MDAMALHTECTRMLMRRSSIELVNEVSSIMRKGSRVSDVERADADITRPFDCLAVVVSAFSSCFSAR